MKTNNLKEMLKTYKLTDKEIDDIVRIVEYIFIHPEFQKRLSDKYAHHGNMSLGEHTIEDMVFTYKLSKKIKKINYNLSLALKIAMFHDLYTYPWQNNDFARLNKFNNKHGFRHPVEAIINACTWFPNDFEDEEDAKIIIDGVVHHMFPLPVLIVDNIVVNNRELSNFDLFQKLPENIQNMIMEATNKNHFLSFSWKKASYLEGRIVSRADKKSSLGEFKNIHDIFALLTGKNKSLKK